MREITHAAPVGNRFGPKQPPKNDFALLIRRLEIYGESALDHDQVADLDPRALAQVTDALERFGLYPYQIDWWIRTGVLPLRGKQP